MLSSQLYHSLQNNPKKLFLIDGGGALLSAVLLGIVLVEFEKKFGIPASTLYFLASFPVFFAIYDLISYRQKQTRIGALLKGIVVMNLSYCCLSLGTAFYHMDSITWLGWTYIITEIIIVSILASVEMRISRSLKVT